MVEKCLNKEVIEIFPKFSQKDEYVKFALKTLGYVENED